MEPIKHECGIAMIRLLKSQEYYQKKYDTETARAVADYANNGNWRDFTHFEETLYQKKTGEFFLYGEHLHLFSM